MQFQQQGARQVLLPQACLLVCVTCSTFLLVWGSRKVWHIPVNMLAELLSCNKAKHGVLLVNCFNPVHNLSHEKVRMTVRLLHGCENCGFLRWQLLKWLTASIKSSTNLCPVQMMWVLDIQNLTFTCFVSFIKQDLILSQFHPMGMNCEPIESCLMLEGLCILLISQGSFDTGWGLLSSQFVVDWHECKPFQLNHTSSKRGHMWLLLWLLSEKVTRIDNIWACWHRAQMEQCDCCQSRPVKVCSKQQHPTISQFCNLFLLCKHSFSWLFALK